MKFHSKLKEIVNYMIIVFPVLAGVLQLPLSDALASGAEKIDSFKYMTVMSKDNELCGFVSRVINFQENKSWHQYSELNWIKWEYGKYDLVFRNGSSITKEVAFSRFDIDNDGKIETVAVESVGAFGVVGEEVYIFNENAPDFKNNPDITSQMHGTFNGFLISHEWPYRLDMSNVENEFKTEHYFRNSILTVSVVKYLKYKNTTYLLIQAASQTQYMPYWVVIAAVKNETIQISKNDRRLINKLDYYCYFDGNWNGAE